MDISELLYAIYEGVLQMVPLFRMAWGVTVILGLAMIIIAYVLKKDPVRKKSPWIIGGLGTLMVMSSGTQLLMSFV